MKNRCWILLLLLSLIPPTLWAGIVMVKEQNGTPEIEITVSDLPPVPLAGETINKDGASDTIN